MTDFLIAYCSGLAMFFTSVLILSFIVRFFKILILEQ